MSVQYIRVLFIQLPRNIGLITSYKLKLKPLIKTHKLFTFFVMGIIAICEVWYWHLIGKVRHYSRIVSPGLAEAVPIVLALYYFT